MNLVALSQAQLAFGGYTFPAAFFLSSVERSVVTDSVDLPFVRGAWANPGKPGKKIYTVSGYLGAGGAILDANGAQMLTADQVQAEIDRFNPYLYTGNQPFQYMLGSSSRFSLCQAQQPKVTYQTGGGYRWLQLDFQMVAYDPCSYGYTPYSQSVQTTSTGGSVSGTFTNLGNFRAYPTITLTFQSACVNPTVLITPPVQGGQIGFTLTGTFAIGDTVIIVCDPLSPPSGLTPNGGRYIQKNGANAWSLLTLPVTNTLVPVNGIPNTELLPFLDPHSNGADSTVSVSAQSGQFTAAFSWRDTWI